VASDTDPAIDAVPIDAVLDELAGRLESIQPTNIGFSSASDVDYSRLNGFFDLHMLNNLSDPFIDGAYPMEDFENFEAQVDRNRAATPATA
jgi:hypothetical protein